MGKSFLCDQIIKNIDNEEFYTLKVSGTKQLNKNILMKAVHDLLQPRSKNILSHRKAKRLVLYIQDLNLAEKNEFGNQSTVEIIRQWLNHRFWINEELQPTIIEDISLVISMSHRGIDMQLDERTKGHFAIINVPEPKTDELVHVFTSIISQHLLGFSEHIKCLGKQLVESSVKLHKSLRKNVTANLDNPQCVFSLKSLSQVMQGLNLSNKNQQYTLIKMCRLWLNEVLLAYGARMTEKRLKDAVLEDALFHLKNSTNLTYEDLYPEKVMPLIGMYSDAEDEIGAQIEFTLESATARLDDLLDKQICSASGVQKVDLVILHDTVHHITNLVRLFSQQSNHNVLLLGEAGSGRKTIVKFAAQICGLTFEQPDLRDIEVCDSGVHKTFWKSIVQRVAIKKEKIVICIDSENVLNPRIFDFLYGLSENGIVSNLFTYEELDQLSSEVPGSFKSDVGKFLAQEMLRNLRLAVNVSTDKDYLR
ncbi:dynein axonemal heavy chain 2-like [Neocloeon triangulifer]|uniref:dynein axonemal heavy chain 2-like n=1 Tax=Neocloeon triangulifer TaxID=2078957 RepID=UPI00286F1B75|nr:dynein axonemal heavy chain 2-like [Neocloeon triangulifer]